MQVPSILAFPTLMTLEGLSLHISTWGEPLYGRVSALPIRLHHLIVALGRSYMRDVVNWLLSQDSIPLIPHLDFRSICAGSAPAVGQYLRIIGPNLTDLIIGFLPLST